MKKIPDNQITFYQSPDEKFIQDIQNLLLSIKQDYDKLAKIYPKNDIRTSFFGLTGNLIHALFLHLLSAFDTFTKPEWWKLRFNKDTMSEGDLQAVQESAIVGKLAYFTVLLGRIESLQRKSINLISPGFDINPKKPKRYIDIYNEYLNSLKLSKFIPLFDLACHIRNTIHSNGIFLSRNENDLVVFWKGRKFEFKHKQTINFMSVDNYLFLVKELFTAIKKIINSSKMQSFNFIEDKYH